MSGDGVFRYSYSPQRNSEIEEIRKKYLPQQESKLDELRRLDHSVHSAGTAQALVLGIGGCAVFGLGLCLSMQVLGHSVLLGVMLGICGAVIMSFAYPVYRAMFGRAKAKHTARILELAAELSGEANDL